VVTDSNKDKVRYSVQDSRTPALMSFLKYLDKKRSQPRPWAGSMLQVAIDVAAQLMQKISCMEI
jgi:hypothetical protein